MPVEGLTVLMRGEPWKAIDGVGISASGAKLTPSKVRYSICAARYSYAFEDRGSVSVEYAPADSGVAQVGGLKLTLGFPEKMIGTDLDLFLLVDLRPLKGPEPAVSIFPALDGGLLASSSVTKLGVLFDSVVDRSRATRSSLNWFYKNGYGFRRSTERGIVFVPEERLITVAGPYGLRVSSVSHSLMVILSDTWPVVGELSDYMMAYSSLHSTRLGAALSSFPRPNYVSEGVRDALFGRIAALLSFGMRVSEGSGRIVGEAGAYWFRETWFRDVFEGLLWNTKTLSVLGLSRFVRDQLDLAMEFADVNGLIPSYLAWSSGVAEAHYESVDSTLLFHQLLMEHAEVLVDRELKARGLSLLHKFVKAAEQGSFRGARIRDGLLLCPPHYSWIDSRVDISLDGVRLRRIPSRVPIEWLRSMVAEGLSAADIEETATRATFLMPEVQARFVLILCGAKAVAEELGVDADWLVELGEASARALEVQLMSRSEGLPPNLVMFEQEGTRADMTPSSASFLALSILRRHLTRARLTEGYSQARSQLLVHRRMSTLGSDVAPFGLIVQRRECEPYFDDRQYHGCVTWPRDSPYLVCVMDELGYSEEAHSLLLNHLDCSVSEGVPFFVHELYGLPLGRNPSPVTESSDQPIPLKNPAQFWSIWFDPYLRWFAS